MKIRPLGRGDWGIGMFQTTTRGARGRTLTAAFGMAGLATAALALSGCSSSLDSAKLSSTITAKINEVAPGATVAVTCPSDVKAQKGGTFDCTAVVDGQNVKLVVTQDDDQGNVSYKTAAKFIALNTMQTKINEQLTQQVPGNWETSCKPQGVTGTVYVAQPGSTFDCTVTGTTESGEAKTETAVVTVPADGTEVTWAIKQS